MSAEITDRELLQLIQGELSPTDEARLENLLSLDAGLRERLERLSGGDQWMVGSAPVPPAHQSARLSLAIERVSQYVAEGTIASPTLTELSSLPTLSGIKLVREIGQGGMGVVYEGFDEALARRVAVKFIQPMRAASLEARERLVREAKATALLHHDNIVTIHSIQTVDGTPALIQQFVDGPTLQEVLDTQGQLPIERCIELTRQLAKGLAAAHAAGIVHRDLKPGNVLIDTQSGIARLADFGMAKHIADLHLSQPEVVSGTPAYMSPEQTRGEPTDGRSDLFSLGAILYTALAGQTPFRGDDPFAVMDQVRNSTPIPLSKLRPDTPVWLSAIIDRLLAKEVEHRIGSADELLQLLDTSSIPSAPARFRLGLGVAALVVLGTLIAFGFFRTDKLNSGAKLAGGQASPQIARAKPVVWVVDRQRSFDTLQAAVKSAADGEVVYVSGDLKTEQIDIVGKRLTISAAPGERPTIRPTEWAIENSPFLFRANQDLTVQGLNIDWPVKTEPLNEPGATLSAMVAMTQSGATLVVEDCSLHRVQGICLASAGDLTVSRCRVSGGKFALGWVANNSQVHVSDSTIDCESGMVVMLPNANSPFRGTSRIKLEGSKFVGQGLTDFILFRHPEHAVELTAKDCVFDVERLVQLSGTTIAANLSSDRVAQNVAKSCVKWHETDCSHREGMEYLASRRIRGANRWMLNGLKGLDAWQKFWKDNGNSQIENARASQLQTELPILDWVTPVVDSPELDKR